MPRRADIRKILIIGSGPIVIGQACEFDYSGTQACKALREEGYQVVLVNSNPATIMTDPETAEATYVEPITADVVRQIIEKERPDALLPTMGGQTGLNTAVELAEAGVLEEFGVELIGAKLPAIKCAEDRELFKHAMAEIGLDLPRSEVVRTAEEGWAAARRVGFPVILRPAFTLGGSGGAIARSEGEFGEKIAWALAESPVKQVLLEESVLGWKEFELEVMRDLKDNVSIICSIENLDPMGIHTGDSITVAPAQTLSDREYQAMRDAAIACIRKVGVECGGSNIQFGVNPRDGRMVVIEMNPRVSRSSALASKATGFPIAKIAAKLAVGLTLDEIPNDITRMTPASFEPSIDYVVVKFPRFTFEKFPETPPILDTQMRSVGEAMAIGRTFREALMKAVRSMEIDRHGLADPEPDKYAGLCADLKRQLIADTLRVPGPDRLWAVARALREGFSVLEIYEASGIDPWFLCHIKELVDLEAEAGAPGLLSDAARLRLLKENGFSDRDLAQRQGVSEKDIREARWRLGVRPVYKQVDTCAAEFEAHTPYLYSTYEEEDEAPPTGREKIIILGGGPNRIGQGIEFDYCCVHGVMALSEAGYEAIMVNCNPETVSTDYDTSDRLYFEPLTLEDVLEIVHREKPMGVIVQFGGQTPLKLAIPLKEAGVPILGTSPESIDLTEDRELFSALLRKLHLTQPPSGTATNAEAALKIAEAIRYPILVRPSYVLGGRAMALVHDPQELAEYMSEAVKASAERPVLIDHFLQDAVEVDVDAVSDGERVVIAGVMEHIEEAGIHSGDSACSLPPYTLGPAVVDEMKRQVRILAKALGVVGLTNVQFAVHRRQVFILEVNPRASRTVPYVSKVVGIPFAKVAARVMAGAKLDELGVEEREIRHYGVKEAVFPFKKFSNVDVILGPEMKSTGEVMGLGADFPTAFLKAQEGAGSRVPTGGKAFLSVRDEDKAAVVPIAQSLVELGFGLVATEGTRKTLLANGIEADFVHKVTDGLRPNTVDLIEGGEVDFVLNTTGGRQSKKDSYSIRRTSLIRNVFYCTTLEAAHAAARSIRALKEATRSVRPLQDYHRSLRARPAPPEC
ncbi:MAG: carbamoyl-phosphate synthase large subunit [Candidatus Tectomicrobia bacterium]|uniref:Carbamoyl phosphate synthase large chain n=1 Tax=Tectimicrobiota bacterium TaxID=2528274 RepID=A0A932MNY4_UNCTE|nr:carbamoyl-phosphate synthase large subunit [Candidatus Tectomicrobia bacterium]